MKQNGHFDENWRLRKKSFRWPCKVEFNIHQLLSASGLHCQLHGFAWSPLPLHTRHTLYREKVGGQHHTNTEQPIWIQIPVLNKSWDKICSHYIAIFVRIFEGVRMRPFFGWGFFSSLMNGLWSKSYVCSQYVSNNLLLPFGCNKSVCNFTSSVLSFCATTFSTRNKVRNLLSYFLIDILRDAGSWFSRVVSSNWRFFCQFSSKPLWRDLFLDFRIMSSFLEWNIFVLNLWDWVNADTYSSLPCEFSSLSRDSW